ncbi:Major facilitator superfamily domain general substrate transporter [Penicillium macrosclerotiorum]|uniref:Major facilitator superfamily domain general substrate transporter n=1 Tax=Penicillium macrosclerotiorum TaxID=303699 RepID=UPI0025469B1F|nr:Major facilitator superfamily domain general substrate transporter [Penicillium macrosclerotiorum]KAJ5690511.1 Major facilitator superfamily domain general substrate transporter [Penicillium macrosclerotiorum]
MKFGISKPESLHDTPRNVLNWKLFWSAAIFGLLGASRGLDEGLVGGMVSLESFKTEFRLEEGSESHQASVLSNITSMVQLGSIVGAFLAFLLCDRLGRVRTLQSLCLLWLVGFIIVVVSHGNVNQVLAGRFIAGLGIGMTTVVGPMYIAEIAPKSVRGMLTNIFAGSVYLGATIAFFSNWRASVNLPNDSRWQWVAPQFAHIGFAIFFFVLSFFVPETPRYFMIQGQHEKAEKALANIRRLETNHPYIQAEIIGIRNQLEQEQEASHGVSRWGKVRELLLVPANRYRLMLGIMSQILGQWSGANSITIYATEFFGVLGKSGQSEKLFASCILGVVKLVSAYFCAFFLIDFVGRRRSLYMGITLQMICLLYIAIYLGIVGSETLESGEMTPSQRRGAVGSIAMIYMSGIGWTMGWNAFQYLVNADIWPLRLRALGSSLVMCLHFLNQFGNTKAVPSMLLALQSYGFFAFSAAVSLVGLVWVWFFVPELTGRSLESTDELFSLPWYKIGRHGHKLVPDADTLRVYHEKDPGTAEAQHVEYRVESERNR